MLPWGGHKGPVPPADNDLRPGEFVMRLLFTEFTVQAERKMEAVMAEPLVYKSHIKPPKVIKQSQDGYFY